MIELENLVEGRLAVEVSLSIYSDGTRLIVAVNDRNGCVMRMAVPLERLGAGTAGTTAPRLVVDAGDRRPR